MIRKIGWMTLSLLIIAHITNLCIAGSVPEDTIVTVVDPTCTEDGYTRYESIEDGTVVIREEVPATGHRFGEWETDAQTGEARRVCTACGLEQTRPADAIPDFPVVRLSGETTGISKSDRVTLEFDFKGPEASFSCYAYTTYQGHASLAFPKKNYTVRLYDDAGITHKHKLVFRQWQNEHKYVLKANYRDPSQARNLTAADIWADMAFTRPNLYVPLRETSHLGAVDGFPVAVYLNDEFHGLYTMNLHIDDDLYGMRGEQDAVMIANEYEPEETRFHALAAFTDEKAAWEVEYCASEDAQWAKDKLNELIAFVMDSDDEQFRARLSEYLDVDGAIDYLIYIYALGLPDRAARDLALLTYDGGPWIPTVYDMERAFGLSADGATALLPEQFLPVKQDGKWDSGTDSLLWDRLMQCFEPEIRARYTELRQGVLTEDNLITKVTTAVEAVPEEYRRMDLALYPREMTYGDPLKQMTEYIQARLPLLDEAIMETEQLME